MSKKLSLKNLRISKMLCTVSHEADTNQNHSGTPLLTHHHSYINSFFKKENKARRKDGRREKGRKGRERREGKEGRRERRIIQADNPGDFLM